MAIAYVRDTGQINGLGVTTFSGSFGTAPAVGNKVIAGGSFYSGGIAPTAADNKSNTYARDAYSGTTHNENNSVVFSAQVATSGGTFTVSFTGAVGNVYSAMVAVEYSGIATTSALDQTAIKPDSTTAVAGVTVGPTSTTTQADELVVTALGPWNYSGTLKPMTASGYTVRFSEDDINNFQPGAYADKIVSVTGAQSAVWAYTSRASTQASGVIATYKAAAGGTSATTATPAAGVATVSGAGASKAATAATAAAGIATVSGVGRSSAATTATAAAGGATVSGTAASTAATTATAAAGVATASATATGVSATTASAAAGAATVSGAGASVAATDATPAAGSATVSATTGSGTVSAADAVPAAGSATVSASGSSTAETTATPADGFATVSGNTSDIDYEAMAAAVWAYTLPNGKTAAETAVETLTLLETMAAAPGCLDVPIEGIFTGADLLRVIAAVQAGKTTITPTAPDEATVAFRAIDDSTTRVTATMEGSERTDVDIDAAD